MKTITLLLGVFLALNGFSQQPEDTITSKGMFKKFIHRDYHAFNGHWSGFNFGFVNLANTDYSNYPAAAGEFMELDWANSFVMQFNLYEQSINLVPRNNFGIVLGLGLEYQRFCFENRHQSITTTENGEIEPIFHNDLNIKRNSFKTLYLTIPVLFEQQFPARWKKRFYVSAGVIGGIRMHSKTKIVYNNEEGDKKKLKHSGSFSMVPFKADLSARIGYRGVSIWGSYTLTNTFKSDKGPELHPYAIGMGLNF